MTNLRYLTFVVAALLAPWTTHAPGPAEVHPSVVPFTIETSGGHPRPVVVAHFNGHSMRMMIHSNASSFSQLRHSQAAAFGVLLTGDHENYGIDRPGHVSDQGLDHGAVASLKVGKSEDTDAPISVFEVPQNDLGMLGIGWINQNRVILDYRRKQALIAPTIEQAQKIGSELRKAGYVALPMTYDEKQLRYVVSATINGVTRSMTIATASSFEIDIAFAEAAGVKHGADQGHGSGPTGTHIAEYRLGTLVRVHINGWTSPEILVGDVSDTYGYDAQRRPASPAEANGGSLGGDFLQKTDAVVDFGTRTLFVRG